MKVKIKMTRSAFNTAYFVSLVFVVVLANVNFRLSSVFYFVLDF